jgi:hypothetical protein
VAKKMTDWEAMRLLGFSKSAIEEAKTSASIGATPYSDFTAGRIAAVKKGHRAGSRLTKAERAFLDASKRYVDKHRRSCSLEFCLAFDTLQAKKVRK